MANSPHEDTSFVLDFLYRVQAASILDVGAGFGRWGFLCRCHLGPGESLAVNSGQKPIIDAVEVFGQNINPIYQAVYNHVYEGDIARILPRLGKYDVIICGHVIEHFEKQEAFDLIRQMKQKASKAIILCIPLNDPLRGAVCGNEWERHRSIWATSEFHGDGAYIKCFRCCGNLDSAVVIYPLSKQANWVVAVTKSRVRRLISRIGVYLAKVKAH